MNGMNEDTNKIVSEMVEEITGNTKENEIQKLTETTEYEKKLTEKKSLKEKIGKFFGIVFTVIGFAAMLYGIIQANRLYLNSKYIGDNSTSLNIFVTLVSMLVIIVITYVTLIPGLILLVKKFRKYIVLIAFIIIPLLVCVLTLISHPLVKGIYEKMMEDNYNAAIEYYDNKEYDKAQELFDKYPNYKDCEAKSFDCKIAYAEKTLESENSDVLAIRYLQSIGEAVNTSKAYDKLYTNAIKKYSSAFGKSELNVDELYDIKNTFSAFGNYKLAQRYARCTQLLIDEAENNTVEEKK